MKILQVSIIAILVLIGISSFGIVNANLEDGLPTAGGGLHPSETQKVINESLSLPGLQNWSHDWQYVNMGFVSAKNMPGLWKYAIVSLKAPSSSAPIPCDIDWWAWVEVDLATYKVVTADYPTMESHTCHGPMGAGPRLFDIQPKMDSPLKQFKSGISIEDIQCIQPLRLFFKAEDSSPVCLTVPTAEKLSERKWLDTDPSLSNADVVPNKAKEFILSSPTFNTFGITKTLLIDNQYTCDLSFVETCFDQAYFDANHPGYGNGTNPMSSTNQITHHNVAIRIYDWNQVQCAVIDGIWDEKNQRPLDKKDEHCGWLYGFKGGFP